MTTEKAELAWPGGDTPGELTFDMAVPASQSHCILGVIREFLDPVDESNTRITGLQSVDSIVGRYKVTTIEETWFVRITSRLGHPYLEKDIIDYLMDKGLSVNPILYFNMIQWRSK